MTISKRTLVLAKGFNKVDFLRQEIPEIRKESYVVNPKGEITREGHVVGYLGYVDQNKVFCVGISRPDKTAPAVRLQLTDNPEQERYAKSLLGNFYDAERDGSSFGRAREIVLGELEGEGDDAVVAVRRSGKVVDLTKLF